MKKLVVLSDAENSLWGSPLPVSKTIILDDRVLAFQQFIMDRFSASIGVPPPSLYYGAIDKVDPASKCLP